MPDKVLAYITEQEITIPAESVPVATTVATKRGASAVEFTWDNAVEIRPFNWQTRSRVGGGAWDYDWALGQGKTVNNTFTRHLTVAERAASTTANIEINVRAIDGAGVFTATQSANANCLGLGVETADIEASAINTAAIATNAVTVNEILNATITGAKIATGTVTSGNILNATIVTGDIAANTILVGNMANDSVDNAQLATDAVRTAEIQNDAVITTKIANLNITNAKIAATTIDVGKLASTSTLRMFEGNGRSKLDKVLWTYAGSSLAQIDIDDLNTNDRLAIIDGTNKNTVAYASTIKTDLALNLVENKTGATIMTDELTDAKLNATTTAILDADAITAVNAASGTITNAKLAPITTPANIAIGTTQFSSAGLLLTGIDNGAGGTLTVANLIAAVNSSGQAQNLNLGSIGAGTLNDIPVTGTAQWVTAAQKTGATNAATGLNASGENTIGIYDGASVTASNIGKRVKGTRVLWADENLNVTGVTDMTVRTMAGAGIGTWVIFRAISVAKTDGDAKYKFKASMRSSDSLGHVRIRVRDHNFGVLATGVGVLLNNAAYADSFIPEVTLHTSVDAAYFLVTIEVDDTAGQTVNIKGGTLLATTS